MTEKNSLGVNKIEVSTANQKPTSGSSTGNPRNKCALKPGHSLLDWIRLGNSGIDLAGTNRIVVPVSNKDLSKHSNWIAIRGKVYNIAYYMDFHPGGVDELMRGSGKDATQLFESIHPWVNYEQLLAKCFVGPLINVSNCIIVKETKNNLTITNNVKQCQNSEIIPRFDWIQKSSEITINFYTKAFCNPGLILKRKNSKEFCFKILFESYHFVYNFEFQHEVNWPPNLANIASGSGKIDVKFTKTQAGLWNVYGTRTNMKSSQLEDQNFIFEICEKKTINHDSIAISLVSLDQVVILPPIGYHFSITASIDGINVSRSYTPVPFRFSTLTKLAEFKSNLYFLIKIYTNGLLTKHIANSDTCFKLELSNPKGNFKLNKILNCDCVVLIAAGSGITPMLGLIEHLMQPSFKSQKVKLLFFNKTKDDIWCDTILKDMCDDRFQMINILSQPNPNWNGETGHINEKLILQVLDGVQFHHIYVCVCGSIKFNNLAKEILNSIDFPSDNIHIFQE